MENCITKEWVMEFLAEEGFRPDLDEDEDVFFKFERKTFWCFFDENDPEYMSMSYFVGYEIPFSLTSDDINSALIELMLTMKMTKARLLELDDEQVRIKLAVEVFTDRKHFERYFERFISVLLHSSEKMAELLEEKQEVEKDKCH
ncbi:MAG: hypothetical protein IJD04_06265 [Desulfovibrionaceae bacterium]|nr:hypothetical protein [Desulfovibrionaceae bacterium]